MRKVKLTQGLFAIVDDQDFERVNKYRWCASRTKYGFYALRSHNKKSILMHRFILGVSDRLQLVDHKDHDTLNNQRDNLRRATFSQNAHNRNPRKNSSSKYLGVSWSKGMNKWSAQIKIAKLINLGFFSLEVDAAHAYNEAAKIHHGEFANLNSL